MSYGGAMFQRFTERARQVVVVAQDKARALGRDEVGTEHILLGLLEVEDGLAARVLVSLGVTLDEVRTRVVPTGGARAEPMTGQIPFAAGTKRVLELALGESLAVGRDHLGTEHILLALVRESEGNAARILRDLDADADAERSATRS